MTSLPWLRILVECTTRDGDGICQEYKPLSKEQEAVAEDILSSLADNGESLDVDFDSYHSKYAPLMGFWIQVRNLSSASYIHISVEPDQVKVHSDFKWTSCQVKSWKIGKQKTLDFIKEELGL